jgi:nitroreductase
MELLEGIERILEAASNSPSYMNTQPWEVTVLSGKKKEELCRILFELAKSDVTPNPDFPLPETWPIEMEQRKKEHGERRFKILGIEREDKQKRKELKLANFEFYGAPCVLFLFMDSTLSSWSILDTGFFAQNIILAAHSFGLGSCLQATLAYYPDAVRKFLGIPQTKRLVLGISIGYPDLEARMNAYRSKKVSVDDFVQWYTDEHTSLKPTV